MEDKDSKKAPQQGSIQMQRQARKYPNKRRTTRQRNEETSSVGSSENASLMGDVKGMPSVKMSNEKALRLLGLTGHPVPAKVAAIADKLLAQHAPEVDGNPRKYLEILTAKEFLVKQQGRVLRQYKRDIDSYARTFQTSVQHLVDKYSNLATDKRRPEAAKTAKYIQDLGSDLQALSTKFLTAMQSTYHNESKYKQMAQEYYKSHATMIDKINDSELTLEEKRILRDAASGKEFNAFELKAKRDVGQGFLTDEVNRRGLFVDLDELHKHLPYGDKADTEMSIDPIVTLREQYADYLADIVALRDEYPEHHQAEFDKLYGDLSTLGDDYIEDISKLGANIEKISERYAEQFQNIVKQGKQDLSKETGTWANMNGCLKALCTVLFFIKYFISLAATKSDAHRMYHPEKISIKDRWERWQMDTMPTLDQEALKTHQSLGKSKG